MLHDSRIAFGKLNQHGFAGTVMTTMLLIRHAQVAAPRNVLLGRNNDVGVSREGLQRATALANNLRRLPISSLWSSPLRRAIETAKVVSGELAHAIRITPRLNEVDYGQWTGCSFDHLEDDPAWRRFNTARSCGYIPAGETIREVERRVAAQLQSWSRDVSAKYIIAVTHAEIIRIAILQSLGLSSDCYDQIEISPCSVSVLNLEGARARILCLNESGQLDCLKNS
jgi:broad specificity phosphatase PhoE